MGNHLYKAYNKATNTVAKTRQVVMLYDGAIRFLAQAKDAMEKNEIERRYKALARTSEIITGLQACLDFEAGGSTAQVLHDFYTSMDMRTMQLHRTADMEECQRVIDELRSMREVWDTIDRGNGAPATAKPANDRPAASVADAQPVIVSA